MNRGTTSAQCAVPLSCPCTNSTNYSFEGTKGDLDLVPCSSQREPIVQKLGVCAYSAPSLNVKVEGIPSATSARHISIDPQHSITLQRSHATTQHCSPATTHRYTPCASTCSEYPRLYSPFRRCQPAPATSEHSYVCNNTADSLGTTPPQTELLCSGFFRATPDAYCVFCLVLHRTAPLDVSKSHRPHTARRRQETPGIHCSVEY